MDTTATKHAEPKDPWHVYVLLCRDGSFYTGIAKDLGRRLAQHAAGKGAKYTSAHGAVKIVYSELHQSHSSAAGRESAIKKLSHAKKGVLVETQP